MKINIFNVEQKIIDGYNNVKLVNGDVDLSEIPANGCDHIICHDILDYIPQSVIPSFVGKLASKLRLSGVLVINAIDINMLIKQMVSGEISNSQFNDIISERKSFSSINDIVGMLNNNGLKITESRLKGFEYEIRSTR